MRLEAKNVCSEKSLRARVFVRCKPNIFIKVIKALFHDCAIIWVLCKLILRPQD